MGAGGGPPCREGALHAIPQRDSQDANFRRRDRCLGGRSVDEAPHHRVRHARIGLVRGHLLEKVSHRVNNHPSFLLIFCFRRAARGRCSFCRTSREDAAETVNVTTLGRCTRSSSSTAFRVDLGFARARRSASSTRISTCWPARRGGNMFFLARAAVAQRARSQPKGGRGCSLHGMKGLLAWVCPDLFSTPDELDFVASRVC